MSRRRKKPDSVYEADIEPKPKPDNESLVQPLKRRKLHRVDEICCSCHEENQPDLLLIGCSNNHAICHMCSRMYMGAQMTMESFPRHFPGKINSAGSCECPMCKEKINGISNIFVFDGSVEKKEKYECPYREVLDHELCNKMFTVEDLQKHLLTCHSQTIKCPNCSLWLHDSHKSTEDIIMFHILKHCVKIKCHGCNRESSVINLYMHSLIENEKVCDTPKEMLTDFGLQLSQCTELFDEDQEESLSRFAGFLSFTVLQYLYRRLRPGQSLPERIYKVFMCKMFICLHSHDYEPLSAAITDIARREDKKSFDILVFQSLSGVSEAYSRKLSQIRYLPYFYRILLMSVSNFEDSQAWFSNFLEWWEELTASEQSLVDLLMSKYRQLIPSHTTLLAYQIPSQLAERSITALQRIANPNGRGISA